VNKWNPNSSFICSDHFSNDDYICNLQAELLGYTPKRRRLKPDAIPTLNLLGHFIQGDKVSTSITNRNKKMEIKAAKQKWWSVFLKGPPSVWVRHWHMGISMINSHYVLINDNMYLYA